MVTWPDYPLDLKGPCNEPSENQSPVRVVEGLMVLTSGTNFWFQQQVSQMPGHHSHVTNRTQKSTLVFLTVNSVDELLWKLMDIMFWCGSRCSSNTSAGAHLCVKLSERRPPQAEEAAGVRGGAGSGGTRIYTLFILYLVQVESWPSLAEGQSHLSVGRANRITISG